MTKSLIREDEYGTYIRVGGYAFRPPTDSRILAGEHVTAKHVGGTQTAKVEDELWQSFSSDPQYKSYVVHGPDWDEEAYRADPRTAFIFEENDRRWDEYKKGAVPL